MRESWKELRPRKRTSNQIRLHRYLHRQRGACSNLFSWSSPWLWAWWLMCVIPGPLWGSSSLHLWYQTAGSTSITMTLPTIGKEFHLQENELQWLVSAYPLSSVRFLIMLLTPYWLSHLRVAYFLYSDEWRTSMGGKRFFYVDPFSSPFLLSHVRFNMVSCVRS